MLTVDVEPAQAEIIRVKIKYALIIEKDLREIIFKALLMLVSGKIYLPFIMQEAGHRVVEPH